MSGPRLKQLVQGIVYLQVALTSIVLGIGEESPLMPLVILAAIGISAYATDRARWLSLKQHWADRIALGMMLLSGLAALRGDRQQLLIVVANLQCYLQVVLLFQSKSPRIYWQLALLSLGQLAIASTLVPGPAFGFFLIAYLVTGLVGFSLLLLYEESESLHRGAARGRAGRSGLLAGAELTGGIAPIDVRATLWQLFVPVSLVAGLTVVAASLLFFSLPRWEVEKLEVAEPEALRTVGFTTTVLLGELGEVVNNSDAVMRIRFFRGHGNRSMKLEGEPLLRGTVVSRYENRTWSQPFTGTPTAMSTEANGPIVRQRITIEPLDTKEVFCIFPVVALGEPDMRLRVDQVSQQLMRREEFRDSTQEFEIATTGITTNRQRDIVPCQVPLSGLEAQILHEPPPSAQFPALRQLAARLVAERGVDPQADRIGAARAVSDYLQKSGQFFYSLDPQQRDEAVDPLEDFIAGRRTGHCEYFAGALVLMLRSLNIPARMVIGFKGGEWNPFGMYYQIQQLHAHAWVEAYLEPDQVPGGVLPPEDVEYGAWLTLDPTAIDDVGSTIARDTGLVARLRQSLDYGRVLWINYVASLNSARQRQAIYEPLAAGLEAALDNLTSRETWRGRLDAVAASPLGNFWYWYRRHWFSWRGGLVAIGFSLAAVGLYLAARRGWQALGKRGWFGVAGTTALPPMLEMYRRLEDVLQTAGLSRRPAQTAREFALAAGGELSERLEYRRVAHLPRRIVDSFYRVRYGGRTLDNQETEAVEHALAELERTLPR